MTTRASVIGTQDVGKLIPSETGDPISINRACDAKSLDRILDPKEAAKAVFWMASGDSLVMTGDTVNFNKSIWGAYDGMPVSERALEL